MVHARITRRVCEAIRRLVTCHCHGYQPFVVVVTVVSPSGRWSCVRAAWTRKAGASSAHNYASAEDRTLIYGWNKGPGVCARVSARLLPRTSVGAVSGSLKTFLWFSHSGARLQRDTAACSLFVPTYLYAYITTYVYIRSRLWRASERALGHNPRGWIWPFLFFLNLSIF